MTNSYDREMNKVIGALVFCAIAIVIAACWRGYSDNNERSKDCSERHGFVTYVGRAQVCLSADGRIVKSYQ